MNRIATLALGLSLLQYSANATYGQNLSKAEAHQSLKRLSQNELAWSGSIDVEDPSQKTKEGTSIQTLMIDTNLGTPKDFSGDVEIGTFSNKTIVLNSKDEFPSLQFLASKSDVVCRQFHGQTPFDARKMANLLRTLFDIEGLSQKLPTLEQVEIRKNGEGFELNFPFNSEMLKVFEEVSVPIPNAKREEVKANRVGVRTSKPKVVSVDTSWSFNREKLPTRVRYEVQFDDPLGALMSSVRGGVVSIPAPGTEASKPTLGKKIIIDLELLPSMPERVLAFKKVAERF